MPDSSGMQALVTGATGLIGFNIVQQLLQTGHRVRVLARAPEKARLLFGDTCEVVRGDVTEPASLPAAVAGCQRVYHAAGFPEQWMKDPDIFQRVNVAGTRNLLEACKSAGVDRVIYTSTIDIFAARAGQTYDESVLESRPKGTHYGRSKQDADRLAVAFQQGGMDIVFLHPSGVYGPGPMDSPKLNQLIINLHRRRIPMLLPGGFSVVYSEDVARGHLLAAEKGRSGDRFILSQAYYQLVQVVKIISQQLGIHRTPPVMPLWMGHVVATAGEALSSITGKPPLISKGVLNFMQWGAVPSSDHARRVLGWSPIPFEEGVERTVAHLRARGSLDPS